MDQKVIRSDILLPLVKESYRAEYTEWDRKNLRFSDAGIACNEGDKCERAVYYDIYQAKEKSALTTGSLVLFDDGRLHESDIRRRLRLILRSPEKEVADPETGARGKLDNTIYYGQVKEQVNKMLLDAGMQPLDLKEDPGLEIKSVNQYQYQEMANSGQVLQSYYDQIQMYIYATEKPFFIVLIKNRNSMGAERGEIPFLEFVVLPDKDRQSQLRSGMKVTKQAIDQNILPPRPFLRDSTQCSFCRFKHICWSVEVEQQEIQRKLEGAIPEQPVFEAALKIYIESGAKISELEKFQDEAKEIIMRYFKATGKDAAQVEDIKATYLERTSKVWNLEILKEKLSKEQLLTISDPDEKKLKELIAHREIDAGIFEEVIQKVVTGYTLRVTKDKSVEVNRQSVLTIEKKEEEDGQKRRVRKSVSTKGSKQPSIKADGKPGKSGRNPGLGKK